MKAGKMNRIDELLSNKIDFTIKPTPICKMEKLSQEYDCNIYVKRDDLLGLGFGGNKLRKLEYILKDALDNGKKAIVASGSLQTNHGMLTALAASKIGLDCLLYLLLEEEEDIKLSGNLLLDDYIGCSIEIVDVVDIMTDARLSVKEKDALVDQRLKDRIEETLPQYVNTWGILSDEVYVISSAGSTPIGILGYINCMKEIMHQEDFDFDYIFCGNGSGGTYGGLLLGGKLYSPKTQILGVSIEEMNPDKPHFIQNMIQEVIKRMGVSQTINIEIEDMFFLKNSINEGYAIPDTETMRVIEKVAQAEGFFLDPVYSGKVMNGVLKYIKTHKETEGKNILILHSGGGAGIFNSGMIAYRNKHSSIIDRWGNDKN